MSLRRRLLSAIVHGRRVAWRIASAIVMLVLAAGAWLSWLHGRASWARLLSVWSVPLVLWPFKHWTSAPRAKPPTRSAPRKATSSPTPKPIPPTPAPDDIQSGGAPRGDAPATPSSTASLPRRPAPSPRPVPQPIVGPPPPIAPVSFVRPSTRPATLPSLSRASGASEKSPSSLRPATASGASSAKVEAADIRVPFARVADQLPPDVFLEPMERLGQSLREPHVLVIPARVVTSQLANGAVHVEWAVIESQFPQLASALPTPALRARFVGWQLSLPMDEVVRQLPLELLPRTIAVTPQGIDAFPAPFKPSVREEATSPAPSAPAVRPTPPHAVPASPLAPWPSLTATPTAPPTLRPPKPTPPVAAPPTLRPPAPTPPVASASAPPAPPVPPPLRTPVRAPASPPVRPPAAPAPATMAPPSEAAIAEAETIARKLARCTAFDTSVRAREGRTVAVFTEAGVSAELAERLARRIAPLLAGRACVAVRAAHGSLVATRGRHAILVAAMRPSTPSAWADSVLAHSPGDDVPAEREDAAVLAPAPHARLADATIAFAGGAEVPAAAFTDAARGLSLCVLAAPMPQTAARLARRVWQALLQEPDPALGTVTRVTVRRGPEVTIVRPLGGARAELLVAVGSAERVGLAHRQIERAAAVLEGR